MGFHFCIWVVIGVIWMVGGKYLTGRYGFESGILNGLLAEEGEG